MNSRTQGCIALLPTGNLTGSVKMWCLATDHTITRDQFQILPMPYLVIQHRTSLAASEGYLRTTDHELGAITAATPDEELQTTAPLPDMMPIDNRPGIVQLADHYVITPDEKINNDYAGTGVNNDDVGTGLDLLKALPNVLDPIVDYYVPQSNPDFPDPAPVLQSTPESTHYLQAQRRGRGVDSLQSSQRPAVQPTIAVLLARINDQ
jgi:hypothetical protein